MRITLSPQRGDGALTLSKSGDVLTINGESFDFGFIPDGATLPASAIDSNWFVGPIERIDGEIHLSLILPHGPNPSINVTFPNPIDVNIDGPIEIPQDENEDN